MRKEVIEILPSKRALILIKELINASLRNNTPLVIIRGRVFTAQRKGRKYVLTGTLPNKQYVGTAASFIIDGRKAYTIQRIPRFDVRGRKRLRFTPEVVEVIVGKPIRI